MATYFARKAGNINASDVWATTPSGTAAAVTFVSGDVLMANSFAITVNVDTDLGATGEVRNDTTSGATQGGGFTLSNGVTLTASVFSGGTVTPCVTYSGNQSANIVGNVFGGGQGMGATNTSSGTLNINGNCTGANRTAAANNSSGTLNITGICTGSGSTTGFGALNNGGGILKITGICTGGTVAGSVGATNNSTGTMLVEGVIQASEFAAGVGGANPQQVTLLTGPFLISTTFGVNPIACTAWRWATALNDQTYLEVGTQTLLEKRNLVTPDNATNFPTASDVRSGTAYGIGGVLEGTCVVPNPAQVAAGTPVDNTVGTLASPSASDIATAVWGAATRTITGGTVDTLTNSPDVPTEAEIATAVWGAATKEITGGTVDTLTNAPTVPSAASIRAEIDSNSTQLAAIKAKTDNLPASPAATGDIPTAAQNATAVWGASAKVITGGVVDTLTNAPASVTPSDIWSHSARTLTTSSGPTAVEIRQEIDANSTKLDAAVSSRLAASEASKLDAVKAKTDALPIERLQNCATTAIVGNLIAQANS
jgi:hypothetical protein